jgi:hypothetical protein
VEELFAVGASFFAESLVAGLNVSEVFWGTERGGTTGDGTHR